jgi:aquaporin related protein
VTLALALIGGVTWIRAGLAVVAELLGSMCAAGVVAALFPGPMGVSTTLSSDTSVARGLCKRPVFVEAYILY